MSARHVPVIYESLCPSCRQDVTTSEIKTGKCQNTGQYFIDNFRVENLDDFTSFFEHLVGKPKSLQVLWMKRLLRGESFSLTAPTGSGKTKFGIIASLFLARQGKKCYLLFPTTLLVDQAIADIMEFKRRFTVLDHVSLNQLGTLTIACYHGGLKKSEREAALSLLNKGQYNVLITTIQFLAKNFEILQDTTFDFIFVDDVDAMLRNSRNIDRVLWLLDLRKEKGKWMRRPRGSLVLASATAKKGPATRIFQELLDFDVGSVSHALRNVEDVIVGSRSMAQLKDVLRRMGPGGIIYAESLEDAERLQQQLMNDFHIGLISARSKQDYEKFMSGELDYLIGTAHHHGTLVRGLDEPRRIRYVVFWGLPSFKAKFDDLTPNLVKLLLNSYRDVAALKKFLPYVRILDKKPQLLEEAKQALLRVIHANKTSSTIVLRNNMIIFPDVKTYIQASGRSSRLLASGLTKGASFVFEDDKDLLTAFSRKASYQDIVFKEWALIDLDKLKQDINLSRTGQASQPDLFRPVLFIVESPTKAKHIARFFGSPSLKRIGPLIVHEVPSEEYLLLVTASLGHVTDLTINQGLYGVKVEENSFIPIYASIKRCRGCGFQTTSNAGTCPRCQAADIDDSRERIEALRKLAVDCEFVIIGTDPDAEGEKIAWDIHNLLAGLSEIRRAEFHEVTARAIRRALKELRDIDEQRVAAQVVRRIEDRWLGFVLSQKVQEHFNRRTLSAGRVQSPVLGWIIEQEQRARKKKPVIIIKEWNIQLPASLTMKLEDRGIHAVTIRTLSERESKKLPLSPHTTDELLRDASQRLKFSTTKTMELAQALFESGLITYHRTDSRHVSDAGLRVASEYLGDEFVPRKWEKEGTHECIRPTRPIDSRTLLALINEGMIRINDYTPDHVKLYDLIFRRFMASQCPPILVTEKKLNITIDDLEEEIIEDFVTNVRGKAFELYRSIWLHPVPEDGTYQVEIIVQKLPEAYPYTQADVVQRMKEERIGRPSTYATILQKLFLRRYIIEKKQLLLSTKLGRDVHSFLKKYYAKYISVERTRDLQEQMDLIERGKVAARDVLLDLHEEIEELLT